MSGNHFTSRYPITACRLSATPESNRHFGVRGLLTAVALVSCTMGVLRYGFDSGSIPYVFYGMWIACFCVTWCVGYLMRGVRGAIELTLAAVLVLVLFMVAVPFMAAKR